MNPWQTLTELLYTLVSFALAAYGLNSLYLVIKFRQKPPRQPAPAALETWPRVTVQLPVYNEVHLVERLLTAVSQLKYPRDKLEVQVLDDSTDATSSVIAGLVLDLRQQGLEVNHIRRPNRRGYKAGALAYGLQSAAGEFIALFDADFLPPPNFLKRAIPWFQERVVGCVQGRWTHVNRNYSLLTRLEALAIDGHFLIEQTVRSANGYFLNFNGTGGVWRRACITDAGGWTADTLTEDLDLSYRAQLNGWRILYDPELVVPAELPVQMEGYKRQQARWAKGSLQTARKLLPRVLRRNLPLRVKLQAALHMTGYLVHPLILAALLLAFPMSLFQSKLFLAAPILLLAALGPPLLFLHARDAEGPGFWARLHLLPGLVLLGIGLAVNNSQAALEGLFGRHTGNFLRTPKFALKQPGERWENSGYALGLNPWIGLEILLGLLAVCGIGLLLVLGNWGAVPWLLLYASSFLFVAGVNLSQSIQRKTFLTQN